MTSAATTAVTQYFCYQCDGSVPLSLSSSSTDPLCLYCSGVLELRVNPNPYSYAGGIFTGPASKSAIEALAIVKIDEDILNSDNNNNCAVCLNTFKLDGVAKEMPCKHIYHKGCIDRWLKQRSNTCLTCRFELPTEEYEARASREEREGGTTRGGEEVEDSSRNWLRRGADPGSNSSGQAREEEEEEEEEGVEDPSRNWLRGGRRRQPTRIGY